MQRLFLFYFGLFLLFNSNLQGFIDINIPLKVYIERHSAFSLFKVMLVSNDDLAERPREQKPLFNFFEKGLGMRLFLPCEGSKTCYVMDFLKTIRGVKVSLHEMVSVDERTSSLGSFYLNFQEKHFSLSALCFFKILIPGREELCSGFDLLKHILASIDASLNSYGVNDKEAAKNHQYLSTWQSLLKNNCTVSRSIFGHCCVQ